MRENRTCSSEGGEPGDRASLPYRPSTEVSFSYDPAQPVAGLPLPNSSLARSGSYDPLAPE